MIEKVKEYLKDLGIHKDLDQQEVYMIYKSLDFKMWNFKVACKNLFK